MKKYAIFPLILVLIVSLLSSLQSAQASTLAWRILPATPDKIDPALATSLKTLQPGDMVTAIVTLRQQADLSRIGGADRATRLQGVIRVLQATANGTQGRLIGLLNSYRAQNLVNEFTPLWVFNGFSVTGSSDVIYALAQDPDVLIITPDDIQIVPAFGTPEANIALVNAPALWSQGAYGQGIVVASMDSGVDVSHPDLASRWRGGSNSWFDPYNQHATPVDLSGHGTWTTGIMVGGDGGGSSVGVAPGAQWIAAKIFNDQGNSSATAIHRGFQWLLDPDGNPNTTDAPQVVNNSWTFAYPGCDLEFELDLQALRAAGILPVFAAGNGGPSSGTSYSPSNNPSAFAVGAIDNNDQIYAYSSRGPSTCGGSTGPYPDLVAPGVNIRTTGLYGTYYSTSGTSFAAPHVAGGLALLLSAYPELDAGMQEQTLINSAVDLGASGPDDVFGYGRLDLLAAYTWAGTAPTSTPAPTSTSLPSPNPTSIPNLNLALNRPVTVSSTQDAAHSGPMAVDGDPTTMWQTERITGKNKLSSEWITVDLGTSQNISQVTVAWDAYFATGYSLQVSGNNSSWSTVFSTSSGDGGKDVVVFNPVQARYVRLTSTAWNNSTYHNWMDEFEIYASAAAAPSPTPTSTSTSPTATPTALPSNTPTPVSASRLHIGDLDGSSTLSGSKWNANVTIQVHDSNENPLANAVVYGQWTNGATGNTSCTTDTNGVCTVVKTGMNSRTTGVTFSVTSVTRAGFNYVPSTNHDPDGDSNNGTAIVISRP